jgi:molybdopterin molybdotransferase
VAVLVTGDELVAPGGRLRRGQIHESNSVLVASTLRTLGCAVSVAPPVPDRPDATEAALAAALDACDLVLTSGGVSVGPHDHVKAALDALGVRRLFWRVAIQPGKPVWAGIAPSGAVVVGLPGNPLSALVGLHLLVRPLLAAALGVDQRPERAVLGQAVPRRPARLRALPVRLRDATAHPLGADDSHLLLHTAEADALALLDAGAGDAPAGSEVPVVRLDGGL